MIKRIIVGSSGGTPSLNFINSLRTAPEQFNLIGICSNKFDLYKAKEACDCCFLVPPAKNKEYLPVLKDIISETKPHFIHVQNDEEVSVISQNRYSLGINTFLPSHKIVELCQDKFRLNQTWATAGLKIPKTFLITNEQDLKEAFDEICDTVWLRATTGAAGKWAVPVNDFNFAKNWINYHNGWGEFCAAEYLGPNSVTWLSIWKNGELIVAQGRKRLYWIFSNRTISGVTGITGTGITIRDKQIDQLSVKAIKTVDTKPHGIYGVDLTYDKDGMPNPTEINIGRFFTTVQFFTEAGLNMPYIYTKLGFGEEVPIKSRRVNPLKPGLAWVRGMDVEPVLTTMKEIDAYEKELIKRLKKITIT